MERLDSLIYKVNLLLNKGIYLCNNESGCGKTYLKQILDKYNEIGYRVATYTFSDRVKGFPITTVLDKDKYDLVFIDRYDMYKGFGIKEILDFAKHGSVLIDCKGEFPYTDKWEVCDISLVDKYTIEVTGIDVL